MQTVKLIIPDLILALALFNPLNAYAEMPIKGYIKGQYSYAYAEQHNLDAFLDKQQIQDTSLDLRLIFKKSWGPWQTELHYQLLAFSGDSQTINKKLDTLLPDFFINPDQTQWFRLHDTIESSSNTLVEQRLDRLFFGYTGDQLVVRLGRQALSWGNGLVFHPMDLFDPFAPNAIDKEYKSGVDMLYGQWLFNNGSDLQGLVVPRRNPITGKLADDQSSVAAKWHYFGDILQIDLMAARHYQDNVAGLGINGPINSAVWRISFVQTQLHNDAMTTSLIANLDNAWQWKGKNIEGYIEYYRNGFGHSGRDYALTDLSMALQQRLARGEVFNTGIDYLASGLNTEWTPLLNIYPLLIFNLDDGSALFVIQGVYSMTENMNLNFGLSAGIGPRGTEFGGLRLSPDSSVYYAPNKEIYIRLSYYF